MSLARWGYCVEPCTRPKAKLENIKNWSRSVSDSGNPVPQTSQTRDSFTVCSSRCPYLQLRSVQAFPECHYGTGPGDRLCRAPVPGEGLRHALRDCDRKEEIAGICRRHRVLRLEVFGSTARGADFDPERSDVDFLVEFEPPTLPGLFRRRMGLVRDLRAAPWSGRWT